MKTWIFALFTALNAGAPSSAHAIDLSFDLTQCLKASNQKVIGRTIQNGKVTAEHIECSIPIGKSSLRGVRPQVYSEVEVPVLTLKGNEFKNEIRSPNGEFRFALSIQANAPHNVFVRTNGTTDTYDVATGVLTYIHAGNVLPGEIAREIRRLNGERLFSDVTQIIALSDKVPPTTGSCRCESTGGQYPTYRLLAADGSVVVPFLLYYEQCYSSAVIPACGL